MAAQKSSALLAHLPSQSNANTQPISSLLPPPPSSFTARTPSQTPFRNEKRSDCYPPSPSPALPRPTNTPSPALPPPTYTTAPPEIATASIIYEYKPTDARGRHILPGDRNCVTKYIDTSWAQGRNESTGLFSPPPPAPSNYRNMPSGVNQGNSGDVSAAEGIGNKFNQNGKNFGKKLGNAGERIGLRDMMNSPVALQSTCSICLEDRARDDFPKVGITSSCAHPLTDICNECIRRFISSELSQRGTAALSCPICRQRMSHHDVYRSAAREDFDRYDERAAIEAMESDPFFRWCPNAGCGSGQIQALGDAEPEAICIQCHEPFCFVHRVRWHRGLTCSQFDEILELAEQMGAEEETEARTQKTRSARSKSAVMAMKNEAKERRQRAAEERLGEAFVRNNSKQCPGCKWPTQRTEGCNHMTCMLKTE